MESMDGVKILRLFSSSVCPHMIQIYQDDQQYQENVATIWLFLTADENRRRIIIKKLEDKVEMAQLSDCIILQMEETLNFPPEQVETYRKENGVYEGREALELLKQYKLMINRHEKLEPLLKDKVATAA